MLLTIPDIFFMLARDFSEIIIFTRIHTERSCLKNLKLIYAKELRAATRRICKCASIAEVSQGDGDSDRRGTEAIEEKGWH